MKLNVLKSSLLISSLVLSTVACTNSKTAKSVESKTNMNTRETISENGKVVSEKYSYRFQVNGCDTEVRSFPSLEEMCAGLQDEKQNSFCAPEDREKKFKESCQGTYSPFVSDSMGHLNLEKHTPEAKQEAPVASDKMGLKEFKTKEAGLEVFKMITDTSKNPAPSALTIIACDSNPTEITTSKRNGILIMPSSKVVLTRDLNYTFKDGSTTANAQPFSTTTCAAQEGEKSIDLTTLDTNLFQVRELKNAMIVYDTMVTSPDDGSEAQTGMVGVMCGTDVTYPTRSQINGIYLTKGSTIALKRDLNSNLIDIHGTISKAPYVVFTCK